MKFNIYMKSYKVTYKLVMNKDNKGKFLKEPVLDFDKVPAKDVYLGCIEAPELDKEFVFTHFEDLRKEPKERRKIKYSVVSRELKDYSANTQKVYVGYLLTNEKTEETIFIDFVPVEVNPDLTAKYEEAKKDYQQQCIEELPSLNKLCEFLGINKREVDLAKFKKLLSEYYKEQKNNFALLMNIKPQYGAHILDKVVFGEDFNKPMK